VAGDFPLTGTGNGTFQYVEPLHRRGDRARDVVYDHAHNDYLEAPVEGGVVPLALGLLAGRPPFSSRLPAPRPPARPPPGGAPPAGRRAGGPALGPPFASTPAALHSFGDFPLPPPAIAFFVPVLCAPLAALGGAEAPPESAAFRLGGPAPAVGAVTLAALG